MILNFIVIVFVLLIGYWWANQGLFSAVIHLLCVVVAGAIALALWEPIGVGLFMKNSWFVSYAMGVALVGTFAVTLFVLRLSSNLLIPGNLEFPKWANLAFGYPVGLSAGVLTMGITVIGLGMIQSQRTMFGFVGQGRTASGAIRQISNMWLPVHKLTAEFYGQMSVGAMSTSAPLRQYNPDVHLQAASLVRDSYRNGRGQVAMKPSQASVEGAWVCPDRCVVKVKFYRGARDFGSQQLILSASQVRLISHAGGTERPAVAFPARWRQEVSDGGGRVFAFDDPSHYVTTLPGRESSDMLFEFPWREGLVPRFIQIKNARLEVRINQIESLANCNPVMRGVGGGPTITVEDFAGAPRLPISRIPYGAISLTASTSPVTASSNSSLQIKDIDHKLSEGKHLFSRERKSVARAMRIDSFYEPVGTRVVQVDISRNAPGSIFSAAAQQAAEGSVPMLVDSAGHTYSAVGYVHENPQGIEIRIEPATGLSADQIPHLPSSGDQKLRVIFYVSENSQVIGLQYGDVSLARCTLDITPKN
jgi:hypothetical protein